MPTGERQPLREALGSPDEKQRYVRRLFARIANRYDLITVLLSYGLDRGWKRRLVAMGGIVHGTRVLDLACGTGDITFEAEARGARATGLDVTPRMVEIAKARGAAASSCRFVVGDMMALPFSDAQFDVVTTGYGIRNVPSIEPALAEIARVLKPGGLLLSLDFNRPERAAVRAMYLAYLTVVGSALGCVLHRDPDTYRYIPESIRRYPGAPAVCALARSHGFETCEWVPVLGGLMAIHRGRRRP